MDCITNGQDLLNITRCRNEAGFQFVRMHQKIMINGKDDLFAKMIDNFKRCLNVDEANTSHLIKCYNRTLYWGRFQKIIMN